MRGRSFGHEACRQHSKSMTQTATSLIQPFEFDKYPDARGVLILSRAQDDPHLPFVVQRVFWITNVPAGEERGKHAHRTCWEALVAVKGQFSVRVDAGDGVMQDMTLDRPEQGVVIPPMVWCELYDFSEDAVCLCLASGDYDPEGYIGDYHEFLKQRRLSDSAI